jgi:hypothetical protein
LRRNKKLIVLFLVLLLIEGILLCRNVILKQVVCSASKQNFGIGVNIQSLNLGLTRSDIKFKNITVMSQEGFEHEPMMKVPLIYADYQLGDLFKKRLRLTYFKVHVSEVVVVKGRNGKLNIDELNDSMRGSGSRDQGKGSSAPDKGKKAGDSSLRIDLAVITVDRILYKDYSFGDKPRTAKIPVGFSEMRFKNVDFEDIRTSLTILASAARLGPAQVFKAMDSVEGLKKAAKRFGRSGLFKGLGKRRKDLESEKNKN